MAENPGTTLAVTQVVSALQGRPQIPAGERAVLPLRPAETGTVSGEPTAITAVASVQATAAPAFASLLTHLVPGETTGEAPLPAEGNEHPPPALPDPGTPLPAYGALPPLDGKPLPLPAPLPASPLSLAGAESTPATVAAPADGEPMARSGTSPGGLEAHGLWSPPNVNVIAATPAAAPPVAGDALPELLPAASPSSQGTAARTEPGMGADSRSADAGSPPATLNHGGSDSGAGDGAGRHGDGRPALPGSGPAEPSGPDDGPAAQPERTGSRFGFEGTDLPVGGFQLLASSQNLSPTGSPSQALPLRLPAEPSAWAETLAARLASFVGNGTDTVDLRLNPPHLGRIEVRITVVNDQASVWLATPNPEVREALQQALPRLESLLQDLGLELADSGVTEERPQGFLPDRPGPDRDFATDLSSEGGSGDRPPAPAGQAIGLLDTWA